MKYVEEWFRLVNPFLLTVSLQHIMSNPLTFCLYRHYELTHTLKTRRVYVASDDPKVGFCCRDVVTSCCTGAWGVSEEVSWD